MGVMSNRRAVIGLLLPRSRESKVVQVVTSRTQLAADSRICSKMHSMSRHEAYVEAERVSRRVRGGVGGDGKQRTKSLSPPVQQRSAPGPSSAVPQSLVPMRLPPGVSGRGWRAVCGVVFLVDPRNLLLLASPASGSRDPLATASALLTPRNTPRKCWPGIRVGAAVEHTRG